MLRCLHPDVQGDHNVLRLWYSYIQAFDIGRKVRPIVLDRQIYRTYYRTTHARQRSYHSYETLKR